jgi:hypothetical protein
VNRGRRRLAAGVLAALAPVVSAGGNLVYNGSFEAGLDYRVAAGRWFTAGPEAAYLDPGEPADGRFSLRFPYSRRGLSERIEGTEVRAAVPARAGPGELTLSISLRSSVPVGAKLSLDAAGAHDVKPQLLASRDIRIGTRWARYQLPVRLDSALDLYWDLRVTADEPGFVWLDAVQLAPGTGAGFSAVEPVEATLAITRPGHVFTSGTAPVLRLQASNTTGQDLPSQEFTIATFDIDGREVHSRSTALALSADSGASADVEIAVPRNGVYRSVLAATNRPGVSSEVTFSVLPARRPVEAARGAFGAYATIAATPLDVLGRIGFRWLGNLTSNSQMIYWKHVEPRPGEFHWRDADLALARERGFELMFNLEPCRMPAWAAALPPEARRAKWLAFVRTIVAHYRKDVRYWTIGDEVHGAREQKSYLRRCWTSAAEYAAWHQAGFQTIREVDPQAQVILNTRDDFAREIFRTLDPSMVDVLAMNGYHAPELLARMREVAVANGLRRLWAPGVAVVSEPLYRAHIPAHRLPRVGAGHWRERNRQLTQRVVETLGLGYERLFHYTGTFVGNTNYFSLFEADSGLKTVGAQFGALIWLLDGLREGSEIKVGGIEPAMRAFRFDRDDSRSVFAIWARASEEQRLTFSTESATDITAFDSFANPLRVERREQAFEIAFGADPIFLATGTGSAAGLERSLASARLVTAALPAAGKVETVGRYALLHGLDDHVARRAPNVSLWYRSARDGWVEVFRNRSSAVQPQWKLGAGGAELTWDFDPPAGRFFLEPGMFPADLVAGAQVLRSRSGPSQPWSQARIEAVNGSLRLRDLGTSPAPLPAPDGDALGYLMTTTGGMRLELLTRPLSSAAAVMDSTGEPGGWALRTWEGREPMLHYVYPAGLTGPLRMSVTISVSEPQLQPPATR